MVGRMFFTTGRVSLGVFILYFIVFRISAYAEYALGFNTMPFPYPGQFLFMPMVVPLIAGYFILKNKSRREGLAFSSNFMLWSFIILLIAGVLQRFIPGLFPSAMGYFLAGPLFFSSYSLIGKKNKKFFIVFLLIFLSLALYGLVLLTILGKTLPFPLNIVFALLFFMSDRFPYPFIGIGLLYNLYLSIYLSPYYKREKNQTLF